MDSNKGLLTAQALAEALNLSVETIWRYTREKRIPYVELGTRQYRYKLTDVMEMLTGSVQETKTSYKSKDSRSYTYQDYLEMPEEPGYSFEILDGVLVKEPAPNVPHQRVSRRLQRILEDYFWEVDPEGEVFDAPLDITFGDRTVVQPDLLYVSGTQKDIVQYTRIDGPPTLVVEIISPSTGRKDRLLKMGIYQRAGVKHYWLVSPEDRSMECFALRDGVYALVASGMDEERVEHPDFSDLVMDLAMIFGKQQMPDGPRGRNPESRN